MDITIAKLISDQAKLYPGNIAIKHEGQGITYRDLEISSNQVAGYFLTNGIKGDDVIAVAMDRSIKLVICLLGIIKAGGAYLPIDTDLPAERVKFMLEDSNTQILCTTAQYSSKYESFKQQHLFEDIWLTRHNYPFVTAVSEDSENDLAYIRYTSGSTGQPKGVAIERRSVINFLLSMQRSPGITADDIILSITTLSFDIAELEIFLPLISGAQLVIADKAIAKDGRALLELIKLENITMVQATPFTWRMILQSIGNERLTVKALCGGEVLTKDLANKLLVSCEELWNMYGPTETTIWSSIKKIKDKDELITIGKPIDNTQFYILNEELSLAPEGVEGELYIGGAGVARGYIGRPELTEERFIDDKFSDTPGKIYKTGDLARALPNGEVQFLGRIDHQVKIRGYRIETEEIEIQLKKQNNIKEAVVITREDSAGNPQLIAYVIADETIADSRRDKKVTQWKSNLRKILPEYMVPSVFISIPKVPLMVNGKLDRQKLPSPWPNSLPETGKNIKNTTEAVVIHIILKYTGFESINADDNFIEMGIDSLAALKIIIAIEEQFDKRFPLTVLVQHPTIRLLTSFIDNSSSSPHRSLIALRQDGSKVPLYLLHGIGLNLFNFIGMISHLDTDQPVYGLRAAGLDGDKAPLKSVESLAAHYNRQILHHDPIGPYAIAGYSFGGIIAFEMVKQLKKAGKEVAMLAMIDTHIQKPAPRSFTSMMIQKTVRQYHKLIFRLNSFYHYPLATIDYLRILYTNKFRSLAIWLGILDKYKASVLPPYMKSVVDRLEKASNKYVMSAYEVKIDLFRAKKRLYYVDDPEMLGWGAYALQGVDIHPVNGDHEDMFEPPHDKILAELLQKRLDEMPANANREESISA
jgi:amino acid adenylation domain-containing protein